MERIITYQIQKEDGGLRAEQYLRRKGYSYQNLTQLKKMPESLLINGVWSYMRTVLREGDTLTVHIRDNESSPNIPPVKLPLDIVYEDISSSPRPKFLGPNAISPATVISNS